MPEPTVQLWEGGAKHNVSDLPGWHAHPECVYDNGKPLAHLHGLSEQPPHTHLPVKSWGEAVPLTGGSKSLADRQPTPSAHSSSDLMADPVLDELTS